jgi:adenylate cyclase
MWHREFAKAEYHQKRAIEINPNDDRTICLSGEVAVALGDGDAGTDWILKAMRVNPYHPARWWGHLGRAHHMAGRYGEALLAFRRVPAPGLRDRAFMASCCVELGDMEGANVHARAILELDPQFSSGAYVASLQYTDQRLLDPLLRGLQRAGLPA